MIAGGDDDDDDDDASTELSDKVDGNEECLFLRKEHDEYRSDGAGSVVHADTARIDTENRKAVTIKHGVMLRWWLGKCDGGTSRSRFLVVFLVLPLSTRTFSMIKYCI